MNYILNFLKQPTQANIVEETKKGGKRKLPGQGKEANKKHRHTIDIADLKSLKESFKQHRLNIVETERNPNCLLHALIKTVSKLKDWTPNKLRAALIKELRKYENQIMDKPSSNGESLRLKDNTFEEGLSWETYLHKMSMDDAWCDDNMLLAACLYLKRKICVISPVTVNSKCKLPCWGIQAENDDFIFIGHYHERHYVGSEAEEEEEESYSNDDDNDEDEDEDEDLEGERSQLDEGQKNENLPKPESVTKIPDLLEELKKEVHIYDPQKSVARRLFKKIKNAIITPEANKFTHFSLFIMLPKINSLFTQTLIRFQNFVKQYQRNKGNFLGVDFGDSDEPLKDAIIKFVSKATCSDRRKFNKLKGRIENEKDTLFLIIHDEAHWGATLNGDTDKFINDESIRKSPNVATLFVSATPYNLLTNCSQIPTNNVTHWFAEGESRPNNGTHYYGIKDYQKAKAASGKIVQDKKVERLLKDKCKELARKLGNMSEDSYNALSNSEKTKLSKKVTFDRKRLERAKILVDQYCDAFKLKNFQLLDKTTEEQKGEMEKLQKRVSDLSLNIVDSLLKVEDDGSGIMVLLRVPIIKIGKWVAKMLREQRDDLPNIRNKFAVLLDHQSKRKNGFNNSLDDQNKHFRRLMYAWNYGVSGDFKDSGKVFDIDVYSKLNKLPCILILCEKGKMGDTFPRTLRHYDLRLRYNNSKPTRAAFEQDMGRACRYCEFEGGEPKDLDKNPLPIVYIGEKGYKCVDFTQGRNLRSGITQDRNVLLDLDPDAKIQWKKGWADYKRNKDHCQHLNDEKEMSKLYRIYSEPKKHFDLQAQKIKDWKDNPRRFLLVGLPQIGKTGAFLWLSKLLWDEVGGTQKRRPRLPLLPDPIPNPGPSPLPEQPIPKILSKKNVREYPDYSEMLEEQMKDKPGRGKYGDPMNTQHYNFHVEQKHKVSPKLCKLFCVGVCSSESDCKYGKHILCDNVSGSGCENKWCPFGHPKDSVAGKEILKSLERNIRKAGSSTSRQNNAHANRQSKSSVMSSSKKLATENAPIENKRPNPKSRYFIFNQSHEAKCNLCQEYEKTVQNEKPFQKEFKMTKAGEEASHLVIFNFPSETESKRVANMSELDVNIPLFTLTSGRSEIGLLNLNHALEFKTHWHILVVKQREYDSYRQKWPHKTILQLPESANSKGVGASRYWTKRVARECLRLKNCFVMDDSINKWEGVTLANDPHPLYHDPTEVDKNKELSKSISLWNTMEYLQNDAFIDREKFAIIGFMRNTYGAYAKSAFSRQHVYSAILMNLPKLQELKVEYNPDIWCWEDIDFNRRVTAAKDKDGNAGVICKCYRIKMFKHYFSKGGCADQLLADQLEILRSCFGDDSTQEETIETFLENVSLDISADDIKIIHGYDNNELDDFCSFYLEKCYVDSGPSYTREVTEQKAIFEQLTGRKFHPWNLRFFNEFQEKIKSREEEKIKRTNQGVEEAKNGWS